MVKRLCFILLLVFSNYALADSNFANRPQVKIFIQEMVKKHHFQEAELVRLFSSVKIRPKVIQSIKTPLEQKPWYDYQRLFVTEWRIREGVKFWNKYRHVLEQAEKQFGVPANIIVATIGIETKFGRRVGDFRVVDALSNLAFNNNSSRSSYFKRELEEFLLLVHEENLNPFNVLGSYAGAIGQPQFMPSSYRRYAINFSGSGKIDLSHNEVDVIGSIANYYKKHGWKLNQPVAIPTSTQKPLEKYDILSAKSSSTQKKTKIIQLIGYTGKEYWLGFHNFDVIKRYNSSNLYAMAVYQLSYYISVLREKESNVSS